MQLQDFFDYKNQFMEDILTNQEIVELINEDIRLEDAQDLVYKQVFPLEYIPETVEEGKTFVCCDVDVQGTFGKTYLSPILYVWVFSHKSKLRLDEGGVRTDKLCAKICEQINGSLFYGLGELNLSSCKRFALMTDFQGKIMTFNMKDFNRQYNPKKPIPTNRKNK